MPVEKVAKRVVLGPAVPRGGLPLGQVFLVFNFRSQGSAHSGGSGRDTHVGMLLDRRTGTRLAKQMQGLGVVVSATFSGDGKRLALGTTEGGVTLWDTSFDVLGVVLRGHSKEVVSLRTDPTDPNRVVTASSDGTARVWDVAGRREVLKVDAKAGPLADAVISPDGRLLLSRSIPGESDFHGVVRLWSVKDGAPVSELHGEESVLFADFVGPGHKLVTGLRSGSAWVWDTGAGTKIEKKRLLGAEVRVRHAAVAGRCATCSRPTAIPCCAGTTPFMSST